MRNHTRSRIIIWLFWKCFIGLSILIFITRISHAQASAIIAASDQISGDTLDSYRGQMLEQEVMPQIVYANQVLTCGEDEWIITLEVWNVGSDGGEAYAQAAFTGQSCVNGKLTDAEDWFGTFSGGPNGILFMPSYGPHGLTCHFEDGLYVKCGEQNVTVFIVQNPEAFGETEAGKEINCFSVISNIDNLKPGEVLSPAIDFVDEKGMPVDILGHALFINGVETWSVVWDGKETRLEVQYTCSNHRGDSKVVILPAYQGEAGGVSETDSGASVQPPQSPPSGGESGAPIQPGDNSAIQPGQEAAEPLVSPPTSNQPAIPGGLPTAIGIAGLVMGLGGAAVSGGVVVVNVLTTVLAKPPVPPKPPTPKQAAPQDKKGVKTEKEANKEKEKKEQKEKKPERKGLLQSEKEALEKYKETLETLSNSAGKGIDLLDGIREISEESKKRITKELKDFKDKLDDMAKKVGGYNDKIEMVQDMGEKLKSLGEKYKQIQKAHQEAFKELKGVPEGAANQLADLTTAIETIGGVADAALSRIPYFNSIYSDKTFEVTKSFKEFATGLRKTLAKTIFHSTIEGNQAFSPEELKSYSDGRTNRRLDPEMQEFFRQQRLNQPKSKPNSILQQVKDFIFGKDISPITKSFR